MILNRDRFAILSDIWGRFRSLSLISPVTPTVGPGDDGFLWIDIGVDGTPENPLWKMWDEHARMWRLIGGGNRAVDWDDIIGKPSTFPPDAHTHSKLVASDGSPDPAVSCDATGKLTAAYGADVTGTLTVSGDTVWHAGNDGAGSGLDADLLDGQHLSDLDARYVNVSGDTMTGGLTVPKLHVYEPAIDDTILVLPLATARWSGVHVQVVNAANGTGQNFPSPTLLAQNDWDWLHNSVWTNPPSLPSGYNRLWARVTLSVMSLHNHGLKLWLRREYYNTATGTWEQMADDPDIYLGVAQVSKTSRMTSITLWCPWWITNLTKPSRGGPIQRLLISGESNYSGDSAGIVIHYILGVDIDLYASNTDKAQAWSSGGATGTVNEQYGLIVNGNLMLSNNASLQGRQFTLNDDTVLSFDPPNDVGVMLLYGRQWNGVGALVLYRASTLISPYCLPIVITGNVALGYGSALTNGTSDGVDGKLNIHTHTDGKIYIKNRMGSSQALGLVFLGN